MLPALFCARVQWLLSACMLLLLLLNACVSVPKPLPELPQTAPPDFPSEVYRQALTQGAPVYRIDTGKSSIVIDVYRGGPLSAVGHNHVIASHDVHGYAVIPEDLANGKADFYFPVSTLQVDEPTLLAEEGDSSGPSQNDIEGTRRNMLVSVLEAEQYPYVRVHVTGAREKSPEWIANTTVTVHGRTRTLAIPIQVQHQGQRVIATGRFHILQTNFGIAPYSILGGALSVKDEIQIRIEIAAEALSAASSFNRAQRQ